MKRALLVSLAVGLSLCGPESVAERTSRAAVVELPQVLDLTRAVLKPKPKARAFVSPALRGDPVPDWVRNKPAAFTQKQKSSSERGINPCWTPDPGFAGYSKWDRAPSMGQMIVPKDLRLDAKQGFDVIVHFHGHESARKEWVQAIENVVLVGIDLGNGSGPYLDKFSTPGEFARLLSSVEDGVAQQLGVPRTKARRIGLTSWSAGYGALTQILSKREWRERIDSVALFDGLHVGYDGNDLQSVKLTPFVRFALQAARGEKFMFVSHSSIIPPTYASTTETANYLIWSVGGQPQDARDLPMGPMGLEPVSEYSKKGFFVRGYAGNDAFDHCAQFGLYGEVLRQHIAPRWNAKTR